MGRQVYIYNDEGCSVDSVKGWVSTLSETLGHPKSDIHLTNSNDVEDALTRQLAEQTTLIMPGGADVPYVKRLGRSVKTIQRVVREGGSYIGTCAGGYFASSACIFEANDASLRVVGVRDLCLLPYAAIGAVREKFCYGSEVGATIEKLSCEWEGEEFEAHIYCNGGAGWDISEDISDDRKTVVMARYTDGVLVRHGIVNESPAAVVGHGYGSGRVVLCGVHPELNGPAWSTEGRYKLVRSVAAAADLYVHTKT